MAITYTQNGIKFTLNADVVAPFPGKYTNEQNYDASTGLYNINSAKLTNLGILPSINSVDIDWNGAQIVNKTVNTTGEVLSILQTAYNYATTYTGKTSLTSSSVLGTINGQSLKFGGSITIETGSDYTHPTFSGVTGSYGTSAAATLTHGGKFNVPYITVNNNGHITAVKSISLTLPAAPTTVSGNAGTATKLAAARKLTIGSAAKTFDGSADVAWTLSEIGAAAASHKHTYTEVGAAAASHTHTYSAVGAAAANHTHTYSAVGAAAANHTHAGFAKEVHEHSNYAVKSHASTATTYGVGTTANYGHLKISSAYATQTTAADVALSLGGAYNMYKHFMTTIASMQQTINGLSTALNNLSARVDELHATKNYTLTVTLSNCESPTLKTGTISENGAQYTVTAKTHYNLPSTITVKQGSTTLTAGTHYTWSNGSLRILPGITDNITVQITANPKSYTVTVKGNATSTTSSVTYTSGEVSVTLVGKSGYTVTGATVEGATYVSFSGNVVKFKSMTGNVTINAQTSEIVLTGVAVTESGSGSGSISGDIVSLTGKGSSITLVLDSTPDNALNKTMTLAAKDSAGATTTKLGMSTSTVTDGNTVSLSPNGAINGAKLSISNNKSTVLRTLTVNVADGTTTGLIVKNSSGTTSSSFDDKGGNVTLTATVTSTRFATQTVNWSKSGGTLSATTGNSVTFTAPANTSETAAVTYTITATCDGKTATYTVTVAKKAASTKYYWYVGQSNPTNMTSISPVVDKASGKEGWRLIGTSVPTYSATNKLSSGWVLRNLPDMTYMYVALPSTSSDTDLCPRDGAGNDGTKVAMYTRLADKVINGVTYKIFKSIDDLMDGYNSDIF